MGFQSSSPGAPSLFVHLRVDVWLGYPSSCSDNCGSVVSGRAISSHQFIGNEGHLTGLGRLSRLASRQISCLDKQQRHHCGVPPEARGHGLLGHVQHGS